MLAVTALGADCGAAESVVGAVFTGRGPFTFEDERGSGLVLRKFDGTTLFAAAMPALATVCRASSGGLTDALYHTRDPRRGAPPTSGPIAEWSPRVLMHPFEEPEHSAICDDPMDVRPFDLRWKISVVVFSRIEVVPVSDATRKPLRSA